MIPDHILRAFQEKNFNPIVDYIRTIPELKSVTDEEGNTLIHLAALYDVPEVILHYAEDRPNDISAVVNMKNTAGDTPIHLAVRYSRFRTNCNDITYQNDCCLLRQLYPQPKGIVFDYPQYDVFVLLWALDADINARDGQGNTALHIATEMYRAKGGYSYDCENYDKPEILSRIITRLITIFNADPAVKNNQGLSCNDLMANAPKENENLMRLANLFAEAKRTKLMREFRANKLSLGESIDAAQQLGCLMLIAEHLYDLKEYSVAYRVYQLIEREDPTYVAANGRMVDILRNVGPEGYAQFPPQEKPSYEEALFTASLGGRRTDLAMELYQAERQRILLLEEENARLKQELRSLKEIHSPSSSRFWRNSEESEEEVANTPLRAATPNQG